MYYAGQTTRTPQGEGTLGDEFAEADTAPFDSDFDFNSVFSLRKPRDIRAGCSSGLKSLGKGFAAGTVSLVAAPALGAFTEGWMGFAKGVGVGEPPVEAILAGLATPATTEILTLDVLFASLARGCLLPAKLYIHILDLSCLSLEG